MYCYKITYNHDGCNATAYIASPYSEHPETVKVWFYNYLRSLNISFLIHKVEIADEEEAARANMNKYHFCFLSKEEW